MTAVNPIAKSDRNAQALQDDLLPGVSRTFALTIPELPPTLRCAITNAYLLCRIADTIEDDVALPEATKLAFHQRFVAVVRGTDCAEEFARDLTPLLSPRTLEAERRLVAQSGAVLQVTHGFNERQRAALERCISIMCAGMPQYQAEKSIAGLPTVADMDRYCYYVAGVVGEMLTELFCDYSETIASRRDEMMPLAVAFGQGLQMTNILKDFWEDRAVAACWLPREVFGHYGLDLAQTESPRAHRGFHLGMVDLIGMAHAYLRDAMRYVAFIPSHETGIRRFCLWAIGPAVHTLQNIRQQPDYHSGAAVKVSRRALRAIFLVSKLFARSNRALDLAFQLCARGLPLKPELMVSQRQPSS